MEYLDAYKEDGEFIASLPRDEVHERGLWHNTVHCWLYDDEGYIYYQIRSDDHKLYTTSSGHVRAGETINAGFGREVKEEIGIDVNYDEAQKIRVNKWQADKIKNGKDWHDRCFSNIHILNVHEEPKDFSFDDGEVDGVVKIKAVEALKLIKGEIDNIEGLYIGNDNVREERNITRDDFLVFDFENIKKKYGYIVEAVIEALK